MKKIIYNSMIINNYVRLKWKLILKSYHIPLLVRQFTLLRNATNESDESILYCSEYYECNEASLCGLFSYVRYLYILLLKSRFNYVKGKYDFYSIQYIIVIMCNFLYTDIIFKNMNIYKYLDCVKDEELLS